jgi:hypothetical protein
MLLNFHPLQIQISKVTHSNSVLVIKVFFLPSFGNIDRVLIQYMT